MERHALHASAGHAVVFIRLHETAPLACSTDSKQFLPNRKWNVKCLFALQVYLSALQIFYPPDIDSCLPCKNSYLSYKNIYLPCKNIHLPCKQIYLPCKNIYILLAVCTTASGILNAKSKTATVQKYLQNCKYITVPSSCKYNCKNNLHLPICIKLLLRN